MTFRPAKYFLVYIMPLVVFFPFGGQHMVIFSPCFIIWSHSFFELFTKGSTRNLNEVEEWIARKDPTHDLLLYGLVPIQYAILLYFLYQIGHEGLPLYAKIGMTTAFGMASGVLGINAAHELGHQNSWYEQLMSKMLLLTTLYMHFFIEHNRGHHKNVSTAEDPASSRFGESVYSFYFRTIKGGWLSAWKLELQRLKKSRQGAWNWHNEMIRFQLIQIALLVGIIFVFGFETLLFYLAGATIGFLLLETVNYIEHYGLQRNKTGNCYERTRPVHSWNSNHPLGRLILLELSRHSDHHYIAGRKYQLLRHFEESPQMPTGYPGMILLSLFPPLWFHVMHKRMALYGNAKTVAAPHPPG